LRMIFFGNRSRLDISILTLLCFYQNHHLVMGKETSSSSSSSSTATTALPAVRQPPAISIPPVPSKTYLHHTTLHPRPKLILIGDSITELGSSHAEGWATSLSIRYNRRMDVVNRGMNGYNSRWGMAALPLILEEILGPSSSSFDGIDDAGDECAWEETMHQKKKRQRTDCPNDERATTSEKQAQQQQQQQQHQHRGHHHQRGHRPRHHPSTVSPINRVNCDIMHPPTRYSAKLRAWKKALLPNCCIRCITIK